MRDKGSDCLESQGRALKKMNQCLNPFYTIAIALEDSLCERADVDDNLMIWLQSWFQSNCNGDWEHGCAIKIANLDNPGWYIHVDLEGTDMENVIFQTVDIEKSEHDWIFCKVEGL